MAWLQLLIVAAIVSTAQGQSGESPSSERAQLKEAPWGCFELSLLEVCLQACSASSTLPYSVLLNASAQ